jgi:N-acetylglucosaminyl-diphospho-decaprenol L-rhamnosyltransferase
VKNKTNNQVAIITVTFNSSEQLDHFLFHATKSVMNPQNVVVVDNNSDDFEITKKLCQKYQSTFLKLDSNIGYGGAINRGVEILSEEIQSLVISNPDTELNPSAVQIISTLALEENIGVVGPKIIDDEGNIYPSARNFPSLRVGVGHGVFSHIWPKNKWTKKYLSETHLLEKKSQTDWVSGACFAIKKSTFLDCKGFDEKYFMYFEDVDLAQRLYKKSYTNYFCPDAEVRHSGGKSTSKNQKAMLKAHHQSAYRYISNKYSSLWGFPIRLFVGGGLSFRYLTTLFFDKERHKKD